MGAQDSHTAPHTAPPATSSRASQSSQPEAPHQASPPAIGGTLSSAAEPTVSRLHPIAPAFTGQPLPVIASKPHIRNPSAAGLQIQTDFASLGAAAATVHSNAPSIVNTPAEMLSQASPTVPVDIQQRSNHGLRSALSAASLSSSLSPSSAISSPALGALADITPLPSPLVAGNDSPGPWRRSIGGNRSGSRRSSSATKDDSMAMLASGTLSPSRTPSRKQKAYAGLISAAVEGHSAQAADKNMASHMRNRSLSEYMPEQLHNARPRHVTLSGAVVPGATATAPEMPSLPSQLHREEYLAAQRGLTQAAPAGSTRTLPTPPSSNRSSTESEEEEVKEDKNLEFLAVRHSPGMKKKLYRPIRALGQGTFSKVMLATSEKISSKEIPDESLLDPKKLVAIKVVEHGPAGGADEERVELSLKREVEILKSISHPSLVHLKAVDWDESQALLVLSYCPGGDLFDLASSNRQAITAPLVQRMFAELVGAVRYLHSEMIVHRDIKLENVLVNVPISTLSAISQPQSHPTPLITLTDLGLSRRIATPTTLLSTRCGSEDYAAPELLLGQPYDGRATDAWALGVLLYALMEGRLPFDPPPGKARGRSRAVHRIARCDWMWCRFGDEYGEWDANKVGAAEWEGAKVVVEGLLKKVSRGRKSLEEVECMEWVKGGLQIDGGLKWRPEDQDDGVVR
ncbi:kinase-like protein [Saccharata proteae CBS 121410]|uniref:Kinase-like protein n=1 Tax=Saccharata proteae CBS 121410 TaxID=1314787 RepID=A0A9P4LXY1_9PEZI|nr:kinase-like protein [Saccharata proteae CBS 121410]